MIFQGNNYYYMIIPIQYPFIQYHTSDNFWPIHVSLYDTVQYFITMYTCTHVYLFMIQKMCCTGCTGAEICVYENIIHKL